MISSRENPALIQFVINQYAHRLAARRINQEEAFSRGLLGLAKALANDKPATSKFVTFAFHCIKQEIFYPTGTKENYWRGEYNKFAHIRQLFYQRTGRQLSNNQLAKLCGVTEGFINRLEISQSFVSLETGRQEINTDEALEIESLDHREPAPWDNKLDKEFVAEVVQEIINDRSILEDNERKVLKLYFGLSLPRKFKMKEIAILFGVSTEAIRSQINRVLLRLSANKRLQELQLAEV